MAWHLLMLGLVWAQATPTLPMPGGQSGGAPATPAPVAPDTVMAHLSWPGAPDLRLVTVTPDSVALGEPVFVEMTGALALPDSLELPPWLELATGVTAPAPGTGDVVAVLRVYRLAPFRLQVGDVVSPVIVVGGRNDDPDLVAPIREPRLPGWAWRTLLGLVAVLLLVAWLVRRLLARQRGSRVLGRDRALAGAAWPAATLALVDLMPHLDRAGGERDFLDGLQGVVRTFVRDRFLIPGREMVGREIAAACDALGHDRGVARRFRRIVETLDTRRYDPSPVSEAWCREQAQEFLAAVGDVRIEPRRAADDTVIRAWARLQRELAVKQEGGGT